MPRSLDGISEIKGVPRHIVSNRVSSSNHLANNKKAGNLEALAQELASFSESDLFPHSVPESSKEVCNSLLSFCKLDGRRRSEPLMLEHLRCKLDSDAGVVEERLSNACFGTC